MYVFSIILASCYLVLQDKLHTGYVCMATYVCTWAQITTKFNLKLYTHMYTCYVVANTAYTTKF